MQPLRGRQELSAREPGVREARRPALVWNPSGVQPDNSLD